MANIPGKQGRAGLVYERYAWAGLLGLTGLLALSAIYIVLAGIDADDFESATGVRWTDIQASQPDVSVYLNRLERLLGAGMFGFALLGSVVTWTGFRNAQRWAWYAMLLFPIVFAITALIFATHSAPGLAIFYTAATVITTVVMVLPVRIFFTRS
jgi:hypothetical protein